MAPHRRVRGTIAALVVIAAGCSAPADAPTAMSEDQEVDTPTTTTVVTGVTTTAPPPAPVTVSSTTTSSTTTTRPPIDDPYVEVDGVRLVYTCAGEGDRTVLVELPSYGPNSNPPSTEDFMGWKLVVDEVRDSVRICVYNRRGIGGSDNPRTTTALRTVQDQTNDLVGVIEALELGPVVMVGHSAGGTNVMLLAHDRPDLIAGAVYVDAAHPESWARILGWGPAEPPEYYDAWASYQILDGKGDMGDKPVYVLTAGSFFETAEENAVWYETHELLAATSTNSVHVFLPDSGHRIAGTYPEEVVKAIEWVFAEIEG